MEEHCVLTLIVRPSIVSLVVVSAHFTEVKGRVTDSDQCCCFAFINIITQFEVEHSFLYCLDL